MVTEGEWKGWKNSDFKIYLDTVVKAFGTDRLMYGSDWPVCLVAGNYEEQLNIVQEYFSSFSTSGKKENHGWKCREILSIIKTLPQYLH